ncbi:tetratricopeptide repeat protein [Muriicola soli]|nr:tetratricopeptide repeat protein [Muriicola soli]
MIALVATIALIWINPGVVASVSTEKLSIAVLPFTNMSDDYSNDWFSIGVTEDILTHLSKVKGLRVISRTSVMQFKDSDKSIPEIAKELDVSYIVEGSVRKQNNQVLITAQLLKANDEHLWADNYNEDLIDAFKIQQEVSQKIVKQLKIFISPEEEKDLNTPATTNLLASELFSRGRSTADNRTPEDLERSIELYKEAIKLDPQFAEAYAEIGNSYMLLSTYGNMPWKEATTQAKTFANKALAINPNTSRSYSVLAFINMKNKNWDKAEELFEKAIEINPNDATAHHHFSMYLRDKPQPDAKNFLKEITEAQRLDPLSKPINNTRLHALLVNDQLEEAKTHFEKYRFLQRPDYIVFNEGLINSAIKKDLRELIYSYERALKDDPDNLYLLYSLNKYYTCILLDRNKSMHYSKRIFEIDPTNTRYIVDKLNNFYYNKRFEEANKILGDSALMDLLNPFQKNVILHDYYAYQDDYEKAQPYLEQLKSLNLIGYYSNKAWSYSKKGDAKTTYEVFNMSEYTPMDYAKVVCFAHLKETDSLFYYLHKISNYAKLDFKNFSLIEINGSSAIDPYRKDPRYIEIMKENYFPVETISN